MSMEMMNQLVTKFGISPIYGTYNARIRNITSFPTVDGSKDPKQPPGMVRTPLVNNGMNYQPQLVSFPDF